MTFYVHVLHALNWVEMPVRPSWPPPHWKCCVIVGGSIVTYLWIIRPSLCPEEGIVHCFWCTSLTKCENLLCEDSPHSCAKILRTAVQGVFVQLFAPAKSERWTSVEIDCEFISSVWSSYDWARSYVPGLDLGHIARHIVTGSHSNVLVNIWRLPEHSCA